MLAIRHVAAKRNLQRGPAKVSPSKVAEDLERQRQAERKTVANFCKQLIADYIKDVPAEKRNGRAAGSTKSQAGSRSKGKAK